MKVIRDHESELFQGRTDEMSQEKKQESYPLRRYDSFQATPYVKGYTIKPLGRKMPRDQRESLNEENSKSERPNSAEPGEDQPAPELDVSREIT